MWQPRAGRAHLIGIAGAGMSALARVMVDSGWAVSGSDLVEPTLGIPVCIGHAAANLPEGIDVVVRSDAIPDDNPELQQALRRNIPVRSYFEMLGQWMSGRRGLAVAGTHGKSTTTAMAATILVDAGLEPTVFCGASPLGRISGGRAGRGDWVLAEACEYRAHFLHLRPRMALVTGIEHDHFDCFDSQDQLTAAFTQFLQNVPANGQILVRNECRLSRAATARVAAPVETFGLDAESDWQARVEGVEAGCYGFTLMHHGQALAKVQMQVPGLHNVANAVAAAALACQCGVEPAAAAAALGRFRGLERRLQHLTAREGVEFWDDYAHHPTEVTATLAALRTIYPGRRLWCIFQPHQASRTRRLLDEFAQSLDNSDKVLVADIYRAREPAVTPGDVTAADLAEKLRRRGRDVPAVYDLDAIADYVAGRLTPRDVVVTLGAGDVRKFHSRLASRKPAV